MKIAIVNYGMGNIYSVQSALNFLGVESEYTNDKKTILNADKIILPGVGSFAKAMQTIKSFSLDKIIRQAVLQDRIPILGICLGMQLLGLSSTEDGYTKGLGLFDGIVEKFKSKDLKIPHVGFDEVIKPKKSILYSGLNEYTDFYFVHSYRMITKISEGVARCNYGETFVASFEVNNIFGTQFHPEKSQSNGLILLKNFLNFEM